MSGPSPGVHPHCWWLCCRVAHPASRRLSIAQLGSRTDTSLAGVPRWEERGSPRQGVLDRPSVHQQGDAPSGCSSGLSPLAVVTLFPSGGLPVYYLSSDGMCWLLLSVAITLLAASLINPGADILPSVEQSPSCLKKEQTGDSSICFPVISVQCFAIRSQNNFILQPSRQTKE